MTSIEQYLLHRGEEERLLYLPDIRELVSDILFRCMRIQTCCYLLCSMIATYIVIVVLVAGLAFTGGHDVTMIVVRTVSFRFERKKVKSSDLLCYIVTTRKSSWVSSQDFKLPLSVLPKQPGVFLHDGAHEKMWTEA